MKRLWLIAAFFLTFTAAFGQGTTPTGTNTAPGCTIAAGVITCGTQSLTPGTGTVTSVSVTTANGVSGSVATPTSTPAITLSLGAITPTTVAIGAGTAITSSGPGGALTSLGFTSPGSGVATALGNTAGGAGGFALVGTTPPTGSAGGSLSGTYPNPSLAAVNSIATSLAIGGATIGANALAVTGTTLHTGNVTIASASLITSGNLSSAAWTTNGLRNQMGAASYTDTTSSGTVANAYTDLFGTSTLLASSATTYTNYYGAYFMAPVASTNVTMTNKSALGADTISIGGAAQGANALAVTGTSAFSAAIVVGGAITAGSSNIINWTSRGILSSPGTGSIQSGNSDAAVPVAQTLRAQSVVAGTAAANGANWTLIGSLPTGTGTSGDIIFQTGVKTGSGTTQGTPTTAMTIKGETQAIVTSALDSSSSAGGALQVAGGASVAKRFWIPAITASSGLQTAVLCQSSGGEMIADSVACLASSARFKNIHGSLSDDVVDKFMKLPIKIWAYKPEGIFKKGNWTRDRIGPVAEDVERLDPRLVEYDSEGQVRAYSTEQLLAYTIKVVQTQQIEIEALKRRLH